MVVSRDAEHVVVPADHPAPQDGASVHRTAASQPRVRGIRVLDGALAQRVVARAVACPLGEAHPECAVAPPSVALRRVRIDSPSVQIPLRQSVSFPSIAFASSMVGGGIALPLIV